MKQTHNHHGRAPGAAGWYLYRGGPKNGKVLTEKDETNYYRSQYTVQTSEVPVPVMMARSDAQSVVMPCSATVRRTRV